MRVSVRQAPGGGTGGLFRDPAEALPAPVGLVDRNGAMDIAPGLICSGMEVVMQPGVNFPTPSEQPDHFVS